MQSSQNNIQQTSIEAYSNIQKSLGDRQRQVYDKLKEMGSATNTMISKALALPINSITPRVYELRMMKLVGVSHQDFCPLTLKKAIFWKIVRRFENRVI